MLQQKERKKEACKGMNRLMEEKPTNEWHGIHIRRKKERNIQKMRLSDAIATREKERNI